MYTGLKIWRELAELVLLVEFGLGKMLRRGMTLALVGGV